MQLIAEAYDILKRGLDLSEGEIADIFEKWNTGVLDSFLIEITYNILRYNDPVDGKPLVTKILDAAGQKGTGKWTAIAALDAGTPVTLIGEAVFARCLSAIKDERVRASKAISGPQKEKFSGDKQMFIDDLEQALYASKLISYTQGFILMRETAKEVRPLFLMVTFRKTHPHILAAQLEPQLRRYCPHVARWLHHQGIPAILASDSTGLSLTQPPQSVFLADITKAYEKTPKLESLLFDDFFNKGAHFYSSTLA